MSRCAMHYIYYLFYALEDSGNLKIEDPTNMFALHFAFFFRELIKHFTSTRKPSVIMALELQTVGLHIKFG